MNDVSGYFMEPQNFSVNDGNGIRTVIFFAGCPLRCQWCSNPESYTELNEKNNFINNYNSEQILKIIEKQKIFYRFSGGGVTFSGGEATVQTNILRELVYKLYDQAIDLAIETSGYFNFDDVKDILEKLNLIFVDIKHMDDNKHRFYTGISNEHILKNISRLNKLKVPVVVRIPVIGGVNSDIDNIRKTARFVKNNIDVPKLELLPYHSFGDSKYEALGLEKPSGLFGTPSPDYLRELNKIVRNEGVEVVSYK
ncbi:MAG: pyruvate formate lyase activating enzyme [Clostridium sp.]|jgi:pyruvate formate lyase activating enzyme